MKRLLYIGLVLGLLVACKDSETDDHVKQEALVTASSLAVGSEGDDEPPMWGVTIGGVDYTQYAFEQGDQIRVVSQKGVDVVLTAEESGTTGVDFVGDIRPVAEVDTYYAVFPADTPLTNEGVISVDLERQDGTPRRAVTLAAVCEDAVDAKIHFDFRPVNALISVDVVGRPCTITKVASYHMGSDALENSFMPISYNYNIASGEVRTTRSWKTLEFEIEEGISGNHFFVAYAPNTKLDPYFALNSYRSDGRWIGYSTYFGEEGMILKRGYTYRMVIDNESEILIEELTFGSKWVEATLKVVDEQITKLYYMVVPQGEEVSSSDVAQHGQEIVLAKGGERSIPIRIDNLTAATAYRLCTVGVRGAYTEIYSSSFTTNPPLLHSGLSLIDYERIECVIEADGVDEIRCLALPADQTADVQRVMQEGVEAHPLSEAGKYTCTLSPLCSGTDYKVFVVGRYGGSYTEVQLHEARTLGEKSLFTLQYEKSGAGWIDSSFQMEGYDEIRCLITAYPNDIFSKEEVYAEGVVPNGKGGGTGVIASHRFENLDDNHEYTIHAVAKRGDRISEVRKLVANTIRPYLEIDITDMGVNWVECSVTNVGYDEIRFLIGNETQSYTFEQVIESGKEPTLREDSDERVQYYTCYDELEPGSSYTIYVAGRSGERVSEMKQERFYVDRPQVFCGVKTSYSYYMNGQSSIANQLINQSFVLGEKLTLNGEAVASGAHSTYYGIKDDEIARGYIQIYDRLENLIYEEEMVCKDGIIGYGQEINLDYYGWKWAAYIAYAVIELKQGEKILSEPIELHLTGLPYDSKEGEFHGFYDKGYDFLPDGYRSLQYPWTDITNEVFDLIGSYIFFRGHDHMHMEGGLRWPQALSPEFHIPEGGVDFTAYMHITRTWNLRDIVLALDFSDDDGNDGSNVMSIKAGSFDDIEATSEVRHFHPDYPCLQIEHQDAFRGPWSRVHRLILRYEE